MDIMLGTTIINPLGLDASAVGSPSLVRGVSGRAVELDTPTQYVKVSGPGHRYECFGDLDLCNLGKSIVPISGRSRIFPRGVRQLPKLLLFFKFLLKTA